MSNYTTTTLGGYKLAVTQIPHLSSDGTLLFSEAMLSCGNYLKHLEITLVSFWSYVPLRLG